MVDYSKLKQPCVFARLFKKYQTAAQLFLQQLLKLLQAKIFFNILDFNRDPKTDSGKKKKKVIEEHLERIRFALFTFPNNFNLPIAS
jgi:hypothetical protein